MENLRNKLVFDLELQVNCSFWVISSKNCCLSAALSLEKGYCIVHKDGLLVVVKYNFWRVMLCT